MRLSRTLRKFIQPVIDFCYHSSAHGMARELYKDRTELDSAFMLVLFGSSIGVPVFSPYFSIRLWPYCLPRMLRWKHLLLRPKGTKGF